MRVYGNAEESAWMAVASVLKMENGVDDQNYVRFDLHCYKYL